MTKSDIVEFRSKSASITRNLGLGLSHSLYILNTTIWLRGELGAGKTTFVQGLAEGLGIQDQIASPTYALENRYGEKLLHVDLYRLDEAEAKRVVEESEDFPGLRVVEWSERAAPLQQQHNTPNIFIEFTEPTPTTRSITITFADLTWPDRTQIEQWREEVKLPEHIGKHCDAVGALGKKLAEELITRGVVVRPCAVEYAGYLHDLLRFVDFTPDGHTRIPHAEKPSEDTQQTWDALKTLLPSHHEDACAEFLKERGYPGLADIIRPHGLHSLNEPETIRTTEQKLLFYADKRIKFAEVVSLDERFDDFAARYGKGTESAQAKRWREQTKEMEKELFGEDTPY